jgi:hypothetical protein
MAQALQAGERFTLEANEAAINRVIAVAHDGLAARFDQLIGSGLLLDAPRLRELVAFIERTALPAAEAYDRLLTGIEASACPNCDCEADCGPDEEPDKVPCRLCGQDCSTGLCRLCCEPTQILCPCPCHR